MENSTPKKISESRIENLALSGGGFYGFAAVGALKEIFNNYIDPNNIKTISGVSVGSIIATMLAIGYSIDEITKIMFEIDMDTLIKDSYFSYYTLWEKFGMYNADKLEQEIERIIRDKTHIKNCTFSQIEKNLIIVTTNLNYQRTRIFSKLETPTMIISKAVRMSISYPFIMVPVLFEGDLYGDGGETLNYPITLFDDDLDKTIGITFANHNENDDGTLKTRLPINNFYDYIVSLGLTMNRSSYISQISSKYLDRSIVIKINEDISSMQFNLDLKQKEYLFECGIKSVKQQIIKLINH